MLISDLASCTEAELRQRRQDLLSTIGLADDFQMTGTFDACVRQISAIDAELAKRVSSNDAPAGEAVSDQRRLPEVVWYDPIYNGT